MSYKAPPHSGQSIPDPALLNTEATLIENVGLDTAKVDVVASDSIKDTATYTLESLPPEDLEDDSLPPREHRHATSRRLREVEAEGAYLWQITKYYLFRPEVAGGLLGIVNIGLLSGACYAFYIQPDLRRDRKVVGSAIASTLLLFSSEGYIAEKYRHTPRGQEKERRVKKEGMQLYKCAREHLLRPDVLGGLLGLVNMAVVGAVGYISYANWDRQRWDRQIVSAFSVGLLGLWGLEGYLAERLRQERR